MRGALPPLRAGHAAAGAARTRCSRARSASHTASHRPGRPRRGPPPGRVTGRRPSGSGRSVGASKPASIFSTVVLPQPDGAEQAEELALRQFQVEAAYRFPFPGATTECLAHRASATSATPGPPTAWVGYAMAGPSGQPASRRRRAGLGIPCIVSQWRGNATWACWMEGRRRHRLGRRHRPRDRAAHGAAGAQVVVNDIGASLDRRGRFGDPGAADRGEIEQPAARPCSTPTA